MGQHLSGLPGWIKSVAVGVVASVGLSNQAAAHVKWFCAFDVAGQPRGLEAILCPDFEMLTALALVFLLGGCLLEATPLGGSLLRALDRVTAHAQRGSEVLVRAVCGFFFVSLWAVGGLILTPELTTTSPIPPLVQLAIAAGLVWRRTLPLSAVGIAVLFGIGVHDYGVFHLMDYPIFLGIAAYLACTGLQVHPFGVRPIDIMRSAAGVTLMWASIEKWAYPEWSFPLFATHPAMTMGYGDEYFMRAAGVVEFTLAFALVWTPLVRRAAAIMLTATFLTAVIEFGKIDAIGHSGIIAVLIAVAADCGGPQATTRKALIAPLGYGVALTGFLAAYYLAHAALFGTTVV